MRAGDAAGARGGDGAPRSGPRGVAPLLTAGALALACVLLGLALADPAPSRHLRGLLVTVDLVLLGGVGTAWLRVVLTVGAPGDRGGIE
ncbi:hypothetical protein [Frankia canadensis]|uniref:hypothetical protein n=1 Tax=Frankia canadensis TaxID=1836972 RepID=UPI001FAEBD59|nr:hypothetical protein [Frankia canadensis]